MQAMTYMYIKVHFNTCSFLSPGQAAFYPHHGLQLSGLQLMAAEPMSSSAHQQMFHMYMHKEACGKLGHSLGSHNTV